MRRATRRRTRPAPWVLAVLALAILPTAAAAQVGPAVPPEVATWFEERAPELVASAGAPVLEVSTDELAEIEVGPPVTVTTWSPDLLAGTSTSPALVTREEWMAPLSVERAVQGPVADPTAGATAPPAGVGSADPQTEAVPVGVVYARTDEDGEVTLDRITAETELADVLGTRAGEVVLVHDEQVGGWFGFDDGTVAPLTGEAREVLAGPVSLDVYQPFLVDRYQPSAPDDAPAGGQAGAEDTTLTAPVWAAVLLLGLILLAGAVVWLRRPEDGAAEPGSGT